MTLSMMALSSSVKWERSGGPSAAEATEAAAAAAANPPASAAAAAADLGDDPDPEAPLRLADDGDRAPPGKSASAAAPMGCTVAMLL